MMAYCERCCVFCDPAQHPHSLMFNGSHSHKGEVIGSTLFILFLFVFVIVAITH